MKKINNYTPSVLIVTNKWTKKQYVHPVIYETEKDLNDAFNAWNTTNTTIERSSLIPVLYDKHFKMLEALKYILNSENEHGNYESVIAMLCKETIKEYEL